MIPPLKRPCRILKADDIKDYRKMSTSRRLKNSWLNRSCATQNCHLMLKYQSAWLQRGSFNKNTRPIQAQICLRIIPRLISNICDAIDSGLFSFGCNCGVQPRGSRHRFLPALTSLMESVFHLWIGRLRRFLDAWTIIQQSCALIDTADLSELELQGLRIMS